MTGHMVHMAMMGLLVSVAAPALLVVLCWFAPKLDRHTVPASVALPGFVVLHFAVTVWSDHGRLPALLDGVVRFAMLVGAMLFWAPVLGVRHRLADSGRTLYLYTAMPLLDLAGVWLVVVGDSAGGLSMIAGMLPMGVAAVITTWNWIHREEQRAMIGDSDHPAVRERANVRARNESRPRQHRRRDGTR